VRRCHTDQYRSFATLNLIPGQAGEGNAQQRGAAPGQAAGGTALHRDDKPRSHGFMLLDHMIVDRAYGGRYQLETGRTS